MPSREHRHVRKWMKGPEGKERMGTHAPWKLAAEHGGGSWRPPTVMGRDPVRTRGLPEPVNLGLSVSLGFHLHRLVRARGGLSREPGIGVPRE